MSSHEIEDVIEQSVRTIDRAHERLEARAARDLIANLYRYQTRFDCGHTHGRVREILRRYRYILHFPLHHHPEAATFPALFDHIERAGAWCSLHEARRLDGTQGLYAFSGLSGSYVAWSPTDLIEVEGSHDFETDDHAGVYYDPPVLQFEVGSRLWQGFVERESLSGLDALAPAQLAPSHTVARIVAEAERQNDRELISWWYSVLPVVAELAGAPADLRSLRDDAHAHAILKAVERTRAFEVRSDWGMLKVPRGPDLEYASEAMRDLAPWWYALSWSLPPLRDRTEVVLGASANLRAALVGGALPGPALTRAVADLADFDQWSSFLSLFQYGFGYPPERQFADRIKRVVDFSSSRPRVDEARANEELSLQER